LIPLFHLFAIVITFSDSVPVGPVHGEWNSFGFEDQSTLTTSRIAAL